MKKIKIAIITLIILLASTAYGATYYINGTSGDDDNNGAIGTPWKTIHKANTTLQAGDTVYIRGGTYTVGAYNGSTDTRGIMPSNSGTSDTPEGRITYSTYQDEIVNLVGRADEGISSMGIWINGKSHIIVTGRSLGQLNFSKMGVNLLIGPWTTQAPTADSSYNEIAYAYFYNSYDAPGWGGWNWQGSEIWKQAYYNHVHHCKFEKHGSLGKTEGTNEGNLFDLGGEGASTAQSRTYYNVIEDNEFLHAGHATFGMFGDHNVIRNNYFHNEGWYDIDGDLYGYRNIISDGCPGYVGYNLFEGNRIGHAGVNYTYAGKGGNWGGTGMKVCSPYNILRYNSYFNNSATALSFNTYAAPLDAKGRYNRIYNNTFFKNGYYLKLPGEDYIYFIPVVFTPHDNYVTTDNNDLVNNLFHDNSNARSSQYGVFGVTGAETLAGLKDPEQGNCRIEDNFNSEAGENIDPLFTNESLNNESSWVLPNLKLQSGSSCVDQGTYLTQASEASVGGDDVTLPVDDALYFQDGNFGQGSLSWPSNINIQADWIAIGTVSNVVQISSINYSTNTITLVSPMTWKDEAPVWLYKKSDGTVVLNDSAPDMGAHEYDSSSPPPPPPPPPTTTPASSSSSGGGGCFIATAAYGSYLVPHVKVLRDFRDKYLLTNPTGREFIRIYYKYSPPVANFISEHEKLKFITRCLITPVVYVVSYPYVVFFLFLLFIIVLFGRKKLIDL